MSSYGYRLGQEVVRQSFVWSRGQFVAIVIAVLSAWAALQWGLVPIEQTRAAYIAYLLPFVAALVGYIMFQVGRAPYALDREYQRQITTLENDLTKRPGPQFVSSMAVHFATMPQYPNSTLAVVDLTIFNRGTTRSVVKNRQFSYVLDGQRHLIQSIPVNLAFDPVQGVQYLGAKMTDDAGISSGGSRLFRESYPISCPLTDINRRQLTIGIEFTDINDRIYSISTDINSGCTTTSDV